MTMAIGDPIGNGATQGSVLFVGPSGVLAQNNSNFFWDNTNQRLGIGTTTPSADLTVRKSVFSGAVRMECINTDTTGSGANAQVTVSVAGANAGDAVIEYEVNGVMSWIVGLDNSESDKFKIASDISGVVNTHLAVTTDGKVGVNVNEPTARLHVGAGSASLAPLKLTAGTNLTVPEAGAMEFDGSDLFVTLSNGRRRFLTDQVANVLDFGAKGDGTTDDAQAFQDAVASLVSTGGVVYLPANKMYKVDHSILIDSNFTIWIVSDMHHGLTTGYPNGPGPSIGKGYVQPGAEITNGIFHWMRPFGNRPGFGGGGGIRGVTIADPPVSPNLVGRNTSIDVAVWVEDAPYFDIENCFFDQLKGSAIKIGIVTVCRIKWGRIYRCGNDDGDNSYPAVHVFGDGSGGYGAARIFDLVLEGTHKAPSVRIEEGTSAIIERTHFEANLTEPEVQQTFVHCSSGCSLIDNGFGALGTGVTHDVLYGWRTRGDIVQAASLRD